MSATGVATPVSTATAVAADIATFVEPVEPHTRCEQVAERLSDEPELFALPIVDDRGAPVGVLNRFRFLERLSQRFGRDLFLRRPIVECLEGPPLVLDSRTPIEQVGAQLFADGRNHIFDGFLVTNRGRYCGVGTGVSLTRALSDLTVTRMRAAVEEAAEQNAAKSAFIANVSHELRTPLNGVIGITALMLDTPLQAEQKDLVELLRASGEALLAIVDDVLDYSKIEAARFQLSEEPFEVRALVGDAVRILAARCRGKNLAIETDVDGSVPTQLIGDRARLRQVLLNLGGNAVKFTSKGRVALRLRAAPATAGMVTLHGRVEDTGIGIAAGTLDRLFQPFTQANPSISTQYGGTGLGLAICKEIVGRMGGTISVSSVEGQGTTFSFSVLLQECAVTSSEPESPLAIGGSLRRQLPSGRDALRVLVAEDNPVNQLVATSLLKKLGCQAVGVGDGKAAIEALATGSFDIVLMDCQMPDVDGLEATRRIRKGDAGPRARQIPIIALTASATTDSHAQCLAAGMDAYLTKPITPSALEHELLRWAIPGTTQTT